MDMDVVYKGGVDGIVRKGPLAQLPDVPPGSPQKVADVLLYSGRAAGGSSFFCFSQAVDALIGVARRNTLIADILTVVAGQMYGAVDPLRTGQDLHPWIPVRKFVTVLFAGRVLNPPFQVACGETWDGPAAVYVADASPLGADGVSVLAATLVHEYTHAALMRVYRNGGVPWAEDVPGISADERAKLNRARDGLRAAFKTVTAGPVDADAEFDADLRKKLKDIGRDWCKYKGTGALDRESVPYVVESLFWESWLHAAEGSVERWFGKPLTNAVRQFVVPDVNAVAQRLVQACVVVL